jgi:murein DD-endopeptidase MepM/ murein hydrolase activator NlpD
MQAVSKKLLRLGSKAKNLFILGFIFAIFLYVSYLIPNASAQTIGDKKDEIQDLQNQINQFQKQIDAQGETISTLQGQLAVINNSISEASLQIRLTQAKIDQTQFQISQTQDQIIQKERELSEQTQILNETLRVIYEQSDQSLLEQFLSTGTLSDYLSQTQYLESAGKKVDTTIATINNIKADLLAKKNSLEKDKSDLVTLKNQYNATLIALDGQQSSKNNLLAQTQGQESRYQAMLSQAQSDYTQAKTELAQMERAASGGGGGGAPSASGFFWPTDSHRVTVGFCGYRTPSGGCHTGIDIGVSIGTPIRSSKDGTVTQVVTGYGNTYPWAYIYGNYVKIDHGNGFVTIYGHLSAPAVGVGQHVTGGQTVIGYSGNTGYSTGPHLHFELRWNNSPINPMPYLP